MSADRFVIVDCEGMFFHFWDRGTYGGPQFGDRHHAKEYAALSGVSVQSPRAQQGRVRVRVSTCPRHHSPQREGRDVIAGCYSLDLYCDNYDPRSLGPHVWEEFPHSYIDERGAVCRRAARKDGWKVNYETGSAICPKCVKDAVAYAAFRANKLKAAP